MSYVDLLDSVKSAHANKYATEWWRKSSPEIQANAISLAKTELMIRVLHGETILVSNNQAFDSVAFLEAVPDLARLDFLDRPPMALAYFKLMKSGEVAPTQWSPSVLIDLSKEYLEKEVFVFSAWVAMDNNITIRNDMLEGMRSSDDNSKFLSMVENVYLALDSTIRDDFRKQARNIQSFYDYLRRLHNQGKNVVRKAVKSDRLIWDDLDDLRYSPSKGIPIDAIKALDNAIISQNLLSMREDRSVLYRLIEDFGSPLREDLRKYIDIYYNQKIGASVSPRGRGTYTITDHDPNTPSSYDENLLENAESINMVEGILGEIALEVIPEQATALNTLTWDDVEKVLREDKHLRDSAYNLQDNLALYGQLDPRDPNFAERYTEWKKITDESLEKHHELLASLLAPKIKYDSTQRNLLSDVSPLIGTAGGSFIGSFVAYLFNNPIVGGPVTSATSQLLADILSSISSKAGDKDLETSAAGNIRESLQKSVKISERKE